jgi:peptide-methionine (S)-S-oxide reductase
MIIRLISAMSGMASLLALAWAAAAADEPTPGASPAPAQPKESAPAEPGKTAKAPAKLERATFATGCFWCGEAVFERLKGVKSVVSGYTGGDVPNPTYEEVGTGQTGHAEAFLVEFDPSVISYDKLLEVFWASHDPTTLNQQGPDYGTQYRSAIFYHNEAQKAAAQKSLKQLADKGAPVTAIVTQLVPATTFYRAETYHQDYYRLHRSAPYCQMYITPKLKKLHLIK